MRPRATQTAATESSPRTSEQPPRPNHHRPTHDPKNRPHHQTENPTQHPRPRPNRNRQLHPSPTHELSRDTLASSAERNSRRASGSSSGSSPSSLVTHGGGRRAGEGWCACAGSATRLQCRQRDRSVAANDSAVRDNDNCWILVSDLDETNDRPGVIPGVFPGVIPGVIERTIRISNATKGCRP
jgi:hypothetical protein